MRLVFKSILIAIFAIAFSVAAFAAETRVVPAKRLGDLLLLHRRPRHLLLWRQTEIHGGPTAGPRQRRGALAAQDGQGIVELQRQADAGHAGHLQARLGIPRFRHSVFLLQQPVRRIFHEQALQRRHQRQIAPSPSNGIGISEVDGRSSGRPFIAVLTILRLSPLLPKKVGGIGGIIFTERI